MAVEDSIFTGAGIMQFIALVFAVIVIGLVLTNPNGVKGFFGALAGFTADVTKAFAGGFAGRSGGGISPVSYSI
jgi:hypothetical protein